MSIKAGCSHCQSEVGLGSWVLPSVPPDVFVCSSCGQKNLLAFSTLLAMVGPLIIGVLAAGTLAISLGTDPLGPAIGGFLLGVVLGLLCGRRYAKLRKWRAPLV